MKTNSIPSSTATLFIALLLAVVSTAHAQNAEKELVAFTKKFQDAYNREDAATLKTMLTADAVRTEVDGSEISGRDNIVAMYAGQFRVADLAMLINPVSVVEADGKTVASGTYHVKGQSAKFGNIAFTGAYLNTVIKENGQWKIARINLSNLAKTMVYHKVADFAKWKEVFDSLHPIRLAAGELSYEVGTLQDDPSVVYVINEWASTEAAQTFFANPKLAEGMKQAGVVEKPHFMVLAMKAEK